MSVNWTPQFLIALGIAATLGNALAIGVHVFTWWLRKRALLLAAILGGLSISLLTYCVGIVFVIWEQGGFGFSWEDGPTLPPPPLPGWQLRSLFDFAHIVPIWLCVIGLVGVVQMRQIPARWAVATLCYGIENFCAVIWLAASYLWLIPSNMDFDWGYKLWKASSAVFIFSLLALAYFRPLFLTVLKYIFHFIKPNSSEAKHIP